jgi:hypothetical protein
VYKPVKFEHYHFDMLQDARTWFIFDRYVYPMEELDGHGASAISEVKQRWSVFEWVTKNL